MYYFTSDIHFGHKNILKYDNRPFKTIDEHDSNIIKNWNSLIKPEDFICCLGDFCFSNIHYAEYLMSSLNGIKYFIKGNHDKREIIDLYKKSGTYLGALEKIKINGQEIILCHYSMKVWDKSHYGSWHLYGHSHGTLKDDPNSLSMDVGINTNNYFPYSFEQISKIMSKKVFKPIDHHGL